MRCKTMTNETPNLCDVANRERREIVDADGASDTELVGSGVVSVNYTVSRSGEITEISVGYNVQGAQVTVELYSRQITAMSGSDSCRRGFQCNEVIQEARRHWERGCPREIDV